MKNINLIGISGKIGSGKDTIGRIIQYLTSDYVNKCDFETYLKHIIDFPEWKIKKFAGKLKEIVSILTGIPVRDLEKQEVKDMVLGEEWWYYKGRHGTLIPFSKDNSRSDEDLIKLTPRLLLQLLGTECGRNIIHPNCWVNATMADYKPNGAPYNSLGDVFDDLKLYPSETKLPNWIITDVRFPNELQSIKDRGGIIIRVNRPGLIESNHLSEISLDSATFDYVIDNNSTIDDLIEKVKNILIQENII